MNMPETSVRGTAQRRGAVVYLSKDVRDLSELRAGAQ
jgi:hypothetical protein